MANKIQSVIAKYVDYYSNATGKTSQDFYNNRVNSDDWLAKHINSTLMTLGATESDINAYIESIKLGYRSALSECMSVSPELCVKTWEYAKKYIGEDIDTATIWDSACGNGRLEAAIENKERLFMSTINSDDVGAVRRLFPDAVVFKNDFLSNIDYDESNAYFSKGLPDSLVARLKKNDPVVFMVEPPSVIDGTNEIKDILKGEYSKVDINNGVLLYFKRIQMIIDFYNLTNVYVVMAQFIERNSWLGSMITMFKPLGGLCYEFNKVTHKYRAAIIWKYAPVEMESEEYINRFTVALDKYTFTNTNDIEFDSVFNFDIKVADREYSKGAVFVYKTDNGCYTNISGDNTTPVTALELHNVLVDCVVKYLVTGGIIDKDTVIDNQTLDNQWYIDSIPLLLFSKYNEFVAKDGVRNPLFPLNIQKIKAYIKDEKVLETCVNCVSDSNVIGLDIVAKNYTKMSNTARAFMDFCIQQIVVSYAEGKRAEMNYIDGTINWDSGIHQIRKMSNVWTVEVEDKYNKLQNDLVLYLSQKILGINA